MVAVSTNSNRPKLVALKETQKHSSFINDPKDEKRYVDFMERVPFYEWAKTNAHFKNDDFMDDLASNLATFGESAKSSFLSIVQQAPDYSQEEAETIWRRAIKKIDRGAKPKTYHRLKQHGFVYFDGVGPHSPSEEVRALKREYDLELRGFTKNEKGKYEFNANIFAQYTLTRFHLVRHSSKSYYIYDIAGYWKEIDEEQLGKVLRDIMHEAQQNIWKKKYQLEYLEALKLEIACIEELNPNEEYLNLENGMLNLDTFELYSHDHLFYSTVRIPVKYNLDAKYPKFKAFLHQIFEGDVERIANIQEAIGDGLDSRNLTQKAYFFHGTGSNGKSVLAEVITHLYGKLNVANVPLSKLGSRFGFQNLPGKVANISTENEVGVFDTQNLKAITGGDFVEIEQKYKTAFSAKLICTLFILSNQFPPTKDLSYGYIRRVRAFPFNVQFKSGEGSLTKSEKILPANPNLVKELLEEIEGLLLFALGGLKRLKENNYTLTPSKACDELLDRYTKVINPTIEFFEECVKVDSDTSTRQPDFYKSFVEWANKKGYSDWSRISSQKFWQMFRTVLSNKGIELGAKKVQGDEYIAGISLRTLGTDQKGSNILNF